MENLKALFLDVKYSIPTYGIDIEFDEKLDTIVEEYFDDLGLETEWNGCGSDNYNREITYEVFYTDEISQSVIDNLIIKINEMSNKIVTIDVIPYD